MGGPDFNGTLVTFSLHHHTGSDGTLPPLVDSGKALVGEALGSPVRETGGTAGPSQKLILGHCVGFSPVCSSPTLHGQHGSETTVCSVKAVYFKNSVSEGVSPPSVKA